MTRSLPLTCSLPFLAFVGVAVLLATPPARAANIAVRGTGDGVTLETGIIQTAIDDCSRQGGGTVTFPAGRYATGTLFLKDNVTIHLEEGAILLGSTNVADYGAADLFREGTGQQLGWSLIAAADARNIGITGPGTIDGRGKELNAARSAADKGKRPILIRFVRCSDVSMRGVHLQSSAMWGVHFSRCHNVRAEGVVIRNHAASNNDGFDIDSCDDVQITGCDIDSGDDALCLKSTSPQPSRNIVVRDCKLASRCSAIKFGTESLGGFENVTISHCTVAHAGLSGIGLYSVDGGTVRNITISDITMEEVQLAIFVRLGARLRTFHEGDAPKTTGSIRDVVIKNVQARKSTLAGIVISGIPNAWVEDVSLTNIKINVPGGGSANDALIVLPEKESAYPECTMFGPTMPAYGLVVRHARNVRVTGCAFAPLAPDARPSGYSDDVESLWIP